MANTAISVLTGAGLFLGPSIGALLYMNWNDPGLPFLAAAAMFLLAALPLLARASKGLWPESIQPMGVLEEVRASWKHISKHRPIGEVLMCFSISTMIFGAIMPMLIPLARHEGFGSEGSGIFVAALGLGWTSGPLSAGLLLRRMKLTSALLLTGLLTPSVALAIGFTPSAAGIATALGYPHLLERASMGSSSRSSGGPRRTIRKVVFSERSKLYQAWFGLYRLH